jgi:hypothetical protein
MMQRTYTSEENAPKWLPEEVMDAAETHLNLAVDYSLVGGFDLSLDAGLEIREAFIQGVIWALDHQRRS